MLPVLPMFPSPVRWRMMWNLALGVQSTVRVTRTGPDYRGFLYRRPSFGLSSLHLAPLSLRLHQLISVPPMLMVITGRRWFSAPVSVLPVWLVWSTRLFTLVVRRSSIAMPVPMIRTEIVVISLYNFFFFVSKILFMFNN